MKPEFVHLHLHSEYSVLDGACRHEELVKQVKDLGMTAVAQTDHGNLFGIIEFYEKAKSMGVKPIIGCEIYVSPGSRFEKKSHNIKEASYHHILLAKDKTGYQNLIQLATLGYLEGFYYRPRVDKEILQKYSEGLIGLSGCLKGEPNYLYLNGDEKAAIEAIGNYQEIFGKGNYFLELQDHGIPDQKKVNRWLVEQSRRQSIPLIATNDSHYVQRCDSSAHDILLCIQTGNVLEDQGRMKFYNDEFYIKSPEEMAERFKDYPESLKSTLEVAERCNVELKFNEMHLPQYPPPKGMTQSEYFRNLCDEGLRKRYGEASDSIRERLEFEIKTIEQMNFISYFLIVWDFIHFAKRNNIPVGPGRGSAAGSLVAYSLEITDIDPLAYGLIFERFLNPSRISMPDIDIDFCDEGRSDVIEYVAKKYGAHNVAQIVTFGTLGAKAAVRDVGRVMGRPYAAVDRIAKLIPLGPKITLKDALEMEPLLKKIYDEEEEVKQVIDNAFKLEGMIRNVSTHAAGIVISEKPLTDLIPLCRGSGGEITTQYPMEAIEKIGLLKMDFLGLRTLSVIHECVEIIERIHGTHIDLNKISLKDDKTYALLNHADTVGIFQLESSGMRDLVKRSGVSCFEDLIALVALYRPGPMHMVDDYIARKHKKVKVQYDHPLLEPILNETYGVMLYQEQVMTVAKVMANFTLAQADTLRRIMGKKIAHQMTEQKNIFVQGALKNGIQQEIADKVFELMAYFAGYGFNKSHSAAYALIAYRTAFFKANYPVEYMTALLSSEMGNTDKLVKYINECRNMGIPILPPDVNESKKKFTVVDKSIRFGLAAIRNVGETVVESIIKERIERGNFIAFYDFLDRVDQKVANRKVLESLIKCGAFDTQGVRRSQLTEVLDPAMASSAHSRRDQLKGQANFFDSLNDSRNYENRVPFPDIPEWNEEVILSHEKELLGFYVTGHPLSRFKDMIRSYRTDSTDTLLKHKDGDDVVLGGIFNKVQLKTTKKGDRMAIVLFEDLEGLIEAVIYPKVFEKVGPNVIDDFIGFIEGRVEIKEEEVKLVVNDVLTLDEAPRRYAKAIYIELKQGLSNLEALEKLEAELLQKKGECPVFLNFSFSNGGKVVVSTSPRFKVQPDAEVLQRLRKIFGEETVTLKKVAAQSTQNKRLNNWKSREAIKSSVDS